MLGFKLVLGRMDALESFPERAATRDDDRAALATLAQRAYTTAERQRLADLVKRLRAKPADAASEEAVEIPEMVASD